jgi:hypothetical protein
MDTWLQTLGSVSPHLAPNIFQGPKAGKRVAVINTNHLISIGEVKIDNYKILISESII